ncbi:hypothetical protein EV368DRAFT_81477 [Lentinula lateritia]|nr:hypothetical protein EV368DRAFT_81477 [Lentinula lateritia]
MPKSEDSATLRYIRRQTRRLTSSITTLINGRRDVGTSTVASPRDELHLYENSQSAVEDFGSIQDSRSNFVDSTEPGVYCVEQDPVATNLQSQTNSKKTMESGTVDGIASSFFVTEPINPEAPVPPPEMIMTISTRGPVGQVAQLDVADNLLSTSAPVATTDPKPKNQNTLQEGLEETVQLCREGSVQSSNAVPSRLREITSSHRDEQPELKETIILSPGAGRLPVGGSSSYRGAIIGSTQNTVARSPSILSSHTAPAPSSSSEHTLTHISTADIATVIDSDAPNVSSSYTDNDALVSVTTPAIKSDTYVGLSCSTASSGLEVKLGVRSSNSVDIPSAFSMASIPTCITGSTASSSRPSVTPKPSHTANSQAESDQPNNPAPSPGLDLSNTNPPSATKGRVRQLSEIAHLPAFYGSNDVVRMNWRKGYGAYAGQTALPTWNPVTKQWHHPRTVRAPIVSASAAPVCVIPVKCSASALAAPVMIPNPASTLSATTIASSTSREGLPSMKSSTLQQGKVQVKTAHTVVKNAEAGISHVPTMTENVSPSPRRSVRIAHSATFPRVSLPSQSAVVMPLLRKRPRQTEDEDVTSEGNAGPGTGESASKKVKPNAGRLNTKIPTKERLMRLQ